MRASWTPIAHPGERRLGDSLVYDILRLLASPFSYEVVGFENITTPGPAIFIANHLGAIGPFETILSVPLRFHLWITTEMLDYKLAPKYLFDDFIHPVLHLNGRFGMLISTLLSKISVRMLRSIGSVSIDRFGSITTDGFRQSLRLLKEGKNLLIFPEDSQLPLEAESLMRPFMPGFVTLCSLFQTGASLLLPVYPVAVHAGNETVAIGKPEFYYPARSHREAMNSFNLLLEERVRSLYLEMKKDYDDLLA